ncbi:hypothetical protein [Cyanothece sp. BG0011]|uniref:hypothetical protein n=1 Tax=Cyanothece sp. BG0011 TaxID=2082950 RepID=UPI000D1FAECF|nr:hypothetical protein [Cyanothece sp. BG0011]
MQLLKHLTANNIKLNPYSFIRELSMEAYLIENESVLLLDNDNFSDIEIIDVELTLKDGRRSKNTDGRIDILALYNQETYAIIELKLGELTKIHLEQLEDYLQQKERLLKYIENEEINKKENKWIGVLVGSSIDPLLEKQIKEGYLVHDSIPVAALTVNRYRGEDNQIYVLTETYFKNISRNYDRTKYKFKDNLYGKGRLVLAVVKDYVENHPNIQYSELKTAFPDYLQGSKYGVFLTLEEAKKIQEEKGKKRHFIKNEEVINLANNLKIAVCTEWGIGNINSFIQKAQSLGFKIQPTSTT